ncbi:MAG: hypothetical protein IPK97_20395 [Ahniella sp.]|nr:hypothetical protein [Ahniella sp.]
MLDQLDPLGFVIPIPGLGAIAVGQGLERAVPVPRQRRGAIWGLGYLRAVRRIEARCDQRIRGIPVPDAVAFWIDIKV